MSNSTAPLNNTWFSPLVAGCGITLKPLPLHVSRWDKLKTCIKMFFFTKRVSVIINTLMFVVAFIFNRYFSFNVSRRYKRGGRAGERSCFGYFGSSSVNSGTKKVDIYSFVFIIKTQRKCILDLSR